jgi:hypothetical protein
MRGQLRQKVPGRTLPQLRLLQQLQQLQQLLRPQLQRQRQLQKQVLMALLLGHQLM